MHFIVQREKNTAPEPVSPQMGGSSPKCGPHRNRRTPSPAWQKPTWPLARLTPQQRGHSWQAFKVVKDIKVFKVVKDIKGFKVVRVFKVVKDIKEFKVVRVLKVIRDLKDFKDLKDLKTGLGWL